MKKSERIKQILLGLLGILCIYIWWGNIDQLTSPNTSYAQPNKFEQADKTSINKKIAWEYQAPKINPFKRFGTNKTRSSQKPKHPPKPRQAAVPPIADQFSVTGILLESNQPQAVLKDKTGQTLIVSVGDSLGVWEVISIGQSHLVCKTQTQSDTLWHATLDLQP